MKNLLGVLIFLIAIVPSAKADYLEDVKTFGRVSGIGLACDARRYKAYETIVRAYLLSAARSDKEQAQGMQAFNDAKAEAFIEKQQDNLWDCNDLNYRFNQQKIFATKLYKDGTLKMPDGKIIKPRRAYDATLVYDRNSNEREELMEQYDINIEKQKAEAQRQGIYDKIRRAEATGRF